MKTIAITALLMLAATARCLATGDAVATTTKEKDCETTVYRRDGKTILKVVLYPRGMLRQIVVFNDKTVFEVTDVRGKRVYNAPSKSEVSVGFEQVSSTGELENVILMDSQSNAFIEIFDVKDSRLIPISGKRMDYQRSVFNDMRGLFTDFRDKKVTPEGFLKRAVELPEKYKTDQWREAWDDEGAALATNAPRGQSSRFTFWWSVSLSTGAGLLMGFIAAILWRRMRADRPTPPATTQ